MPYIKIGIGVLWTLLLFVVVYCLLRTMTGVSNHEFDGNGTVIYLGIAGVYSLITTVLGLLLSKKWFYFLYALVGGTIAAPFIFDGQVKNAFYSDFHTSVTSILKNDSNLWLIC